MARNRGVRVGARCVLVAALLLVGGGETPHAARTRPVSAPAPVRAYAPPAVALGPASFVGAVRPVLSSRKAPAPRVSPKGTELWRISATSGHDLPVAAETAYRRAAGDAPGGCGIPWWLLAGIGRVESDHGRYGDADLGADGVSRPAIIGIQLNGNGPVAAIRDTDDGALDHDPVWDRAVGPMQFIPSTWALVESDGDGDGRARPQDIDDAALAAADYLCASGGLPGESAMRAAVHRYNQDDFYVDLVMAFAHGYETGVFLIPLPPLPEPEPAEEELAEHPVGTHQPAGTKPPKPGGSGPPPAPNPNPNPTPAPDPPREPDPPTEPPAEEPALDLVPVTGTFQATADGWSVGTTQLDVGGADRLDVAAHADFDGDGTVETNRAEFDGLVGLGVTVQVARGTGVVYVIDGEDYRGADGTFLG